ncbi:conserved hypothetical protein [Histoplasma capsulatum H143]|uniref:Uncharacterized protein n=1 Tax=Ajellomyces capsulatus (strain H143) TaxID=544712 RepID=C6HF90_AJECH|nr:conserved hypothetical protein [Histoplasma capsulatum H143]
MLSVMCAPKGLVRLVRQQNGIIALNMGKCQYSVKVLKEAFCQLVKQFFTTFKLTCGMGLMSDRAQATSAAPM